jgi:hypothetical protein
VGYAPLVEQNVRRSDVSVNDAPAMHVSKRPAQLPGCPEELTKRHRRTAGLKIPAAITESAARQVLEHKVWIRRIKIKIMQGNDAIVSAYLAHHLHFSLAHRGSRTWIHDGKGNLPMSARLHVRRQIGPLTLAVGNDALDAVAVSEDRTRRKGCIDD